MSNEVNPLAQKVQESWDAVVAEHVKMSQFVIDLQAKLDRAEEEIRILRKQDDDNNGSDGDMSMYIKAQTALNRAAENSTFKRTLFVNELTREFELIGCRLRVPRTLKEVKDMITADPRVGRAE